MDLNCCRLCLDVGDNIIPIFGDYADSLNIKNILKQHFWFQEIQQTDNLPKGICETCWKHLKDFHDFYQTINTLHKNRAFIDNQWEYHHIGNSSSNVMTFKDKNNMTIEDGINFVNVDDDHVAAYNIKDEIIDTFDTQNKSIHDRRALGQFNSLFVQQIKLENANEDHDHHQPGIDDKINKKSDIEPPLNNQHTGNGNDSINNNGNKIKTKQSELKQIAKKRQLPLKNEIDQLSDNNMKDNNVYRGIDNISKKYCTGKMVQLKTGLTSELEDDGKLLGFYNLSCMVCLVEFSTIRELQFHCRTVHAIKRATIACIACNKKLSSRSLALEHMKWHSNPNEFKCEQCNKVCNSNENLRTHRLYHKKPEERQYHCDLCGDSFTIRNQLIKHFQSKHNTITFQCKECDKCYNNQSALCHHIKRIHRPNEAQMCHICAKQFKSKSRLQEHVDIDHSNQIRPKVQCQLCGAILKDRMVLQNHLRRIHRDQPIICKLCGKTIKNKNSFGNHMRNMHTNVQEYKCTCCGKIFRRSHALKEHMASHSGRSILYPCKYCPATFNSNANYSKHRKNKHFAECLAEKTNQCIIQM